MGERAKPIRCAIYTRKSSEEGLEQDFNSLHAQREACEAYIVSQKQEGWRVLPRRYDDGGCSGGTMERPSLQQLLANVASGLVDIIVVYKVDRLTRSLTDFARIVDVLDQNGASFVSVTQAFNTTTSMGRLTLNVLLSFAQFEREVTGERIRDKIAASKRKGLWMGGFVPLGYEARDRTLVIHEAEAETVRTIYRRYLELGSVDALKAELDRQGFVTKLRAGRSGKMSGGHPFARGHLYRILSNPLYAGRIRHKKQVHAGQHAAIIDGKTWKAVQASLARNSHRRRIRAHAKSPSLLAGLLVDEQGERLFATHANKQGRRYRYYASRPALKQRGGPGQSDADLQERPNSAWRLPAAEIESAVIRLIIGTLQNEHWLVQAFAAGLDRLSQHQALLARARDLAQQLEGNDDEAKRGLMLALVHQVTIEAGRITIDLRYDSLLDLASFASPIGDGKMVRIEQAFALRQRGPETRLVIEGEEHSPEPDPVLVKALAQAHRWWEDLLRSRYQTMRELARAYGTDERYVARILPLAFLPAELTRAILTGTQPPEMTLHHFLAGPSLWCGLGLTAGRSTDASAA